MILTICPKKDEKGGGGTKIVTREIKIYNTLTRRKDVLRPLEPGRVKFYSCGPTTYDLLHVGNARALVVGDLVHRSLKNLGYQVTFVRNFTDVDDKIIDRAQRLGIDPLDHSAKYIGECLRDMESLGMLPATHVPKVSTSIAEIIAMIQTLVDKEHAYVSRGEVLFHVPSFRRYGTLSGRKTEELEHGKRVAIEGHKRHPSDFVLWKPAAEGGAKPCWESPWGRGRPGWHIECSAMARTWLGERIDLHHGGTDLIFPHHENEIAQSEAANGASFCNIWIHNAFVNFGSEKMAKSSGNVVTIRDFVSSRSGAVLRHLLGSIHYRSPLDWSEKAIDKAQGDVRRIHEFAKRVYELPLGQKRGDIEAIDRCTEQMKEALADDFHVPKALGLFFSLIRDFNRDFSEESPNRESLEALRRATDFMGRATGLVWADYDYVLGQMKGAAAAEEATEIEGLVRERAEARRARDWKRADEIRLRLADRGVVVKDNPDGTVSWSIRS